jgi:hypothetical protein
MPQTALDVLSDSLSPDVAEEAARRLGEAPAATAQFLEVGGAAVLRRLIDLSRQPGGPDALLSAMRRLGATYRGNSHEKLRAEGGTLGQKPLNRSPIWR